MAAKTDPAPDTFTDLEDVAACGDGRLWHARDGNVWTFAGCPVDRRGSLHMPIVSVPDARVRAALDAGAWIAAVVDTHARPVGILAVQRAPADGTAPVVAAHDLGIAAAA